MSFYQVSFFTGKRRCFLLFRNKTQFAGLVSQFNVSMLLSFSIFRMKREGQHVNLSTGFYII